MATRPDWGRRGVFGLPERLRQPGRAKIQQGLRIAGCMRTCWYADFLRIQWLNRAFLGCSPHPDATL